MTCEQEELLLTVARILRARVSDPNVTLVQAADDLWALNEALKPFGPSEAVPQNPKAPK